MKKVIFELTDIHRKIIRTFKLSYSFDLENGQIENFLYSTLDKNNKFHYARFNKTDKDYSLIKASAIFNNKNKMNLSLDEFEKYFTESLNYGVYILLFSLTYRSDNFNSFIMGLGKYCFYTELSSAHYTGFDLNLIRKIEFLNHCFIENGPEKVEIRSIKYKVLKLINMIYFYLKDNSKGIPTLYFSKNFYNLNFWRQLYSAHMENEDLVLFDENISNKIKLKLLDLHQEVLDYINYIFKNCDKELIFNKDDYELIDSSKIKL